MSYQLQIKIEAIADMTQAFNWYEDQLKGLGTQFLNEVDLYFDRIVKNPMQYKSFRYERIAIMHRFPYKIVYEIEKELIIVYAIYHNKRNPEVIAERKV